MEKMFVNTNFPHVEVVNLPNGEGWTPNKLAGQIQSLYKTKNFNADIVIVWFDREKNTESSDEIRTIVREALADIGVPEEKLKICIPDKMTENMILADEALVRSEFSIPDFRYEGDGTNGKHSLKALYEAEGQKYKETYHGVSLLKKTHLSRAAERSPSVGRFVSEFDSECWWNR